MIHVSRREHFSAAHKLYNHAWSAEKNKLVYGPCANENWHGHNFELTVTVSGEIDPETGFVTDFKKMGLLIRSEIIEKVDHKNLNMDVPFLQGKLTSCENIAVEFWKILAPLIPTLGKNARLHAIRLEETTNNYVEYFGKNS